MRQRYASGLVDLLHENMVLRAEVEALVGILRTRELTGQIAGDWFDVLKTERKTQSYQGVVHRYDDVIAQVAEVSTRADVDRVLESVELYTRLT